MFVFSVLFVLCSSYLFLSILDKKNDFKNNLGLIFFILIVFSQIILSIEILSVFKQLTRNNLFALNIVFVIISIILCVKNDKHLYKPLILSELKKIINALKRDKMLMFVALCFIVFIVSILIVALFFPIRYADALSYYFSRCTMWIQNMGISHYITVDSRELIMPINSELMYTWVFLFLKNEIGTGIFPCIFYINAIYVIYNLLGELGFCRRKRLWSVFVFSAFPLIYVESSLPGGDLWTGSLILTCIYLFVCSCKYNKNILFFFSALSYALALGVKTTAVIMLPSVLFILFLFAFLYGKNNVKVNILKFCGFLILNFVLFSSYNYILNFIDFSNPVSDKSQLLLNSFRGGIKGYFYNLIQYIFIAFDFSGVADIFNIGTFIENLQSKILSLLKIDANNCVSPFFPLPFKYTSEIGITKSLLGVIGFFTFYLCIIYAFIFGLLKRTSKKRILLFGLSVFYIVNILIFARVMVFTNYNMRYLLAFVIVSSPIIVYTYIRNNRNLYKWILCILLFVYLAFIPHAKPLSFTVGYLKYISLPKQDKLTDISYILNDFDEAKVRRYFLKRNKCRIGVMLQTYFTASYYIKKLCLDGYNISAILPEIITTYNLSEFDYIIISKSVITSNLIKNFKTDTTIPNISECIYKNYNQKIITPEDNEIPAVVTCHIPLKYLLKNGFEVVENINLNSYLILKNKNSE